MIVFDASTLILLARIELLDMFVRDFPGKVLIPETVKVETIGGDREGSRIIERLIEDGQIVVKKVKNTGLVKKFRSDFCIDAGEAEALALALEEQTAIIATDDRNAIKASKLLRLDFITAIAVLVRAVEKGRVARDDGIVKLGKLRSIGRYGRPILEDAETRIRGGI